MRGVAHRRHAVGAHISADVEKQVTAHTQHHAVLAERKFDIAGRFARMANGHEMFAAIFDPLHRPVELARAKRDEKVFRIEFSACAKTAADIKFNVIHSRFRQVHHCGHGRAVEERQFGGARNGELAVLGVPLGQKPARLHGQRSLALR